MRLSVKEATVAMVTLLAGCASDTGTASTPAPPPSPAVSEAASTTSTTDTAATDEPAGFDADGIPFHLDILHSVGTDFAGDVMWVTLDGHHAVGSHQIRPLGDPADEGCPYALRTYPLAPGFHVIEVETGRTAPQVITFELSAESRGVIQYRDPSNITWRDLDQPAVVWEITPGPAVFRMNQNNGIDLCPRWEMVADTEPSEPVSTSTIPPTTAAASVATEPPGPPPTFPAAWSRVPHDETAFGGEAAQKMHSVTAGGPGLVAVGVDRSTGDSNAAVWTSPDGVTWSRVPHDEAVFGGGATQVMWSVTTGGPGLVAVGLDRSGDDDAVVWTSPDGLIWSRIPDDGTMFGGNDIQGMFDVASGGPGLVAVGIDWSGGDMDAAVWTSPDGLTWSRVPHNEAVFGGDSVERMRSVVAGGPGVVAVGDDRSEGDNDAAVWTSPDGLRWSRVPHNEAVFGGVELQAMQSIAVGGPGLVAVGYDASGGDFDAAVWTSPDGMTWFRVPHDEAVFGGQDGQGMASVVAAGPGLVAVGWDSSGGDADVALWISADGLTWSRAHEPVFGGEGNQEAGSVVPGGPGLVVVGWNGSLSDSDAAVWLAETED